MGENGYQTYRAPCELSRRGVIGERADRRVPERVAYLRNLTGCPASTCSNSFALPQPTEFVLASRRVPDASKSDPQVDREAATSVRHLVNSNPTPRELNSKALAVLIFPEGNQTSVVTAWSGVRFRQPRRLYLSSNRGNSKQ